MTALDDYLQDVVNIFASITKSSEFVEEPVISVFANELGILTLPTSSVLYVKISNSNPAFWGLTKNQLDCLELNKTRWFAVLLARAIDNGYVFTSNEVIGKIKTGTFELAKDGDYKVNENTDCGLNNSFNGFVQLLNRILQSPIPDPCRR